MKALFPFVTTALLLATATAYGADPTTGPTTAPASDTDEAVRDRAVALLCAGKQAEAEQLIFKRARAHPSLENDFFAGVLVRSRFNVRTADTIFDAVHRAGPDTLAGDVARLVLSIDRRQDAEANFTALDQLSAAHPNNPLVLWLVALECRQLHKADIGIVRYTRLLQMFNPGPSLLHQTLGNLYLEKEDWSHALEQFDAAIALEPASWDYNGRGLALVELKRYDEAEAAYRKAAELNPNSALVQQNWSRLRALRAH